MFLKQKTSRLLGRITSSTSYQVAPDNLVMRKKDPLVEYRQLFDLGGFNF
jgi:hypothetical protein